MKGKFFAVMFSLVAAQSAFAGSTIAEVISSGGFVAGPAFSSGVQIQNDGRVISFHGSEKKIIAVLSQERVQALVKAISEIESSALVRDNPDAPICMDAPSTSYRVVQNGKKTTIASIEGCQPSHLSNGGGYSIERVLDGLKALTYL